jgi:hypothetical protein
MMRVIKVLGKALRQALILGIIPSEATPEAINASASLDDK